MRPENSVDDRMQAGPAASHLLQLPPEVLCHIWEGLRGALTLSTSAVHQHALRCTCKAMRDLSTPWIDTLHISVLRDIPEDEDTEEEQAPRPGAPVPEAMQLLARFPNAAQMRSLRYTCMYTDNEPHGNEYFKIMMRHALSGLLPSFMLLAQERLSGLRSFTYVGQYFDYGDAAAIASTCPQLQSITIRLTFVKGPIFAPFRQLRSLSSLSMHHLDCPQQHHAVLLSSLAHLTTLTRLHINQPYSHYTTELGIGKLVALATVALLPKVASLTRLREVDIEIEASNMVTAGEALAESIVGLQHLTSLKVRGCSLPFSCPPLACGPFLRELALPQQTLDSRLIRLFAAMPLLTSVDVWAMQPDSDLSQLPCSWGAVKVMLAVTLQQLLWLPRGIRSLSVMCKAEWTLEDQGDMEATCSVLREVGEVLAERPGWSGVRLKMYWLAPRCGAETDAARAAADEVLGAEGPSGAAAGTQASQGEAAAAAAAAAAATARTGAASTAAAGPAAAGPASTAAAKGRAGLLQQQVVGALFQALSPLRRYADILCIRDPLGVCAELVRQGAQCLPALITLDVKCPAPGFEALVAALGEVAWLKILWLFNTRPGDTMELEDGAVAALRAMALRRLGAGRSLMVESSGQLSKAQLQTLNQAVAKHCTKDCHVIFY